MPGSAFTEWSVSVEEDVLTLALAGHVDEFAASLYLEIVRMEVATHPRMVLVVDLHDVTRLDRAGVAFLHQAKAAVDGGSGRFMLLASPDGIEVDVTPS